MERTSTDITWDEYVEQMPLHVNMRQKTNILCPDCGRYIYRDMSVVLTTYPPQYYYNCECGWHGVGH